MRQVIVPPPPVQDALAESASVSDIIRRMRSRGVTLTHMQMALGVDRCTLRAYQRGEVPANYAIIRLLALWDARCSQQQSPSSS